MNWYITSTKLMHTLTIDGSEDIDVLKIPIAYLENIWKMN